jgi:MraZ protein
MLIGEYTHSLDDKNRISLPVKFRKEVGKKVVLTHGLDNCLFLYPLSEWKKISEKLSGLSIGQADTRGFNRFMQAGACEVDIDSAGRLLLPEHLKVFAGLGGNGTSGKISEGNGTGERTNAGENGQKVVFAGVNNRIELWNETRWIEYKKRIESQADRLAEKLGEIGVF